LEYARQLVRRLSESSEGKGRYAVRKTSFASGVERFARSDRTFAVTSVDWDQDRFLLGTPQGTVDLRTGQLRPADPNDRITKITATAPSPNADCPQWLEFLNQATGGDAELVRFLQLWCGYTLTGDTREHALIFVYGPGGNGKSVFLNIVSAILGDYAKVAAMETFTDSASDKHPTDLAMLRGSRLVTASETEDGRAWAETKIKQMTGGDRITARFMRQDFFTYSPQFKLTIVGNHKPALRNVDEAIRRRFNIVPFLHKPAKPDPTLEAELRDEMPGILRWMLAGCLEWQKNGLKRPKVVIEATREYFEAQDVFAQWLDDECDAEPGNEWRSEKTGDLYRSWSDYAVAAGEKPAGTKSFSEEMQRRGFEKHKGAKGARMFRGIRLRPKRNVEHEAA
jgi:putative DNA primase/helicase